MVTFTHANGSTATLDKSGTTVTMQLAITTGITGSSWAFPLPVEFQALYPFQWYSLDFQTGAAVGTGVQIDVFSAGDHTVTWQAATPTDLSPSLAALSGLVGASGPTYTGYAPTGAQTPYNVLRPLLISPEELALDGSALGWDTQYTVYCCGGSVEASFNLAKAVIQAVHGQRMGGTTLSTSMGYVGAQVEGHYESQVTIQFNQGGI